MSLRFRALRVGLFALVVNASAFATEGTVPVEKIEIPKTIRLDGAVEAVNGSTLAAQTSGRVEALYFDVDDYVEQGDVVAKLKDTEQQAGLSRAGWRSGESWFWDCLVDADLASNAASWQWCAGSGADAAPYFRIFNPVLQSEKFDPEGEYLLRYCPELAGLPAKFRHKPWEASDELLTAAGIKLGIDYPTPILDLKVTRERALESFRALV